METVEQLHSIITDPKATPAQKDEAAKLLLEASGEATPEFDPPISDYERKVFADYVGRYGRGPDETLERFVRAHRNLKRILAKLGEVTAPTSSTV